MEIKQLRYFVTAADFKSLNKAAEFLYTSQPNMSKVISNFEMEVGFELFDRTHRGIRLTTYGEKMYEYAQTILKNVEVMLTLSEEKKKRRLSVSSYPSNMVSRLLTDFIKNHQSDPLAIEFHEGSVEEITDNVANFISEIGIVYVAQKQLRSFQHIMAHKKLEFITLDTKEACIYVGRNNPLFEQDSIDFQDLEKLKFIQGTKDFFSMEHHLDHISVGAISTENLNSVVHSNSDHLVIDLLLYTDICSLGIEFMANKYTQYDIKSIKINNCDKCLVIGYVKLRNEALSSEGLEFVDMFKKIL